MANRRTMRKRKKLGMWKQDTWKYYVLRYVGDGKLEFLGTCWGYNRGVAVKKALDRYKFPTRVIWDGYLVALMVHGKIINEDHPKLVRDRKLMESVRIERDCREGFIEDTYEEV